MKQLFTWKKGKSLLLLAALFAGNTGAWADETVESFEQWGETIGEGWMLINDATYGNSYTFDYVVGSSDYTPSEGNNCLANSGHPTGQGTVESPMIVTPSMTGTLTFKFRKYNSSSSTKGYINIFEYDEESGKATGNSLWTCRPSGVNEATSKYQDATINVGEKPRRFAIYLAKVSIDEFTYTPAAAAVEGPGLAVNGYKSGDTFSFGMVNAGAEKTITLNNPGTATVNVNIATTGGFTATPTTLAIEAKATATVTVTAPAATATGKFTATATESGVAPVELTLTCAIKDPNKMYEDFSGNALPEDWETVATGSSSSSNAWNFANGYAAYAYGSIFGNYSDQALVTPLMIFTEGEKVIFKARIEGTTSASASIAVEYNDGAEWKTIKTFTEEITATFQTFEVAVPAAAKRLRFNGRYFAIDEVYGGMIDATPRPKLEVEGIANGGSLSWGWASYPAGSEKTITVKNPGKADLDVTFSATDDYTLSATTATIKAGESFELTIGTPAHDGNGVLTIKPAANSGLADYTITLTSNYKVPKAVMGIDIRTVDFGKVSANAEQTVTVSNTGDAKLTATIDCDNAERFAVSAASIEVEAGESKTFTITYKYDPAISGTYTATITVTPNDGSALKINASARNKKAGVWSEDFEDGIPASWTNDGWIIGRKWNEENSVNHAYTTGNGYLITPRLKAEAGETLIFEFVSNYANLVVEYANDIEATEWKKIEDGVDSYTENDTITFTAPAAGTYYLRFSGSGAYLDNFEGFNLDLLPADAIITASTLPATGNQFAPYKASVTVENKGSEAQTAVAQLYFNGEVVATEEAALAVESKATIGLEFIPQVAVADAAVKVVVTLKGILGFTKSVEGSVTIAEVATISETAAAELVNETVYAALRVDYTPANGYNTIALPFAPTTAQMTQIFGEGWKAYYFQKCEDGILKFQSANGNIRAGVPFIVYVENARTEAAPVLENVTITAAEAGEEELTGDVLFKATYAPMTAATTIDNEGEVVKDNINGMRGYFEIPEGVEVYHISIDGVTVGISQLRMAQAEQGAYNLKGQRVAYMKKGGLYIVNGKKIVK